MAAGGSIVTEVLGREMQWDCRHMGKVGCVDGDGFFGGVVRDACSLMVLALSHAGGCICTDGL